MHQSGDLMVALQSANLKLHNVHLPPSSAFSLFDSDHIQIQMFVLVSLKNMC